MKGIDIFCASQAATAIRCTMEEITAVASSSSSSAIQLGGSGGGRAIDRFNPIITDSRRRTAPVPKPPAQSPGGFGKTKKDKISKSSRSNNKKKNSRKAAAGEESGGGGGGWRCTKPGGFITPQSSSRYLLNENEDDKDYFLDVISDFNPILKLDDPDNDIKNLQQLSDQSGPSHTPLPLPPPPSSSSPPPSRSADQVVVVLRVSLHCRGCERKMRKHLSRMQGVSSFNIDFAAKKVTVVGDVTPLGVLASISKVKNAQLWSPAVTGSSIPAAVSLSNSSSKTAKPPAVATVPTTNENMENISRNIQLISMN